MYEPRRKIYWFALTSRITVILLQLVFNTLCPDHEADAFKRPVDLLEKSSLCDNVIEYLFGGLARWDGEYFLHIAKYGYTYENSLAFYPLYPLLIRIASVPISRIFFILNSRSSMLVAAVLINVVCFIKSAVVFYDLSKAILKKSNIAYKAAVLYCLNPASIFFSAIYSESLFAYLTFYSMLKSAQSDSYVSFPIGLSILTRSNGIINIGFPIYFQLKKLFHTYTGNLSRETLYQYIFSSIILKTFCAICNTIIISMAQFVLLQIYNYIIFCIPNPNQIIPPEIIAHSVMYNLTLPGSDNVEWCYTKIPIAYSYIQKKYWNVGFLSYYQMKQIPNFILAFPILYIMIKCIKEYFVEHKRYFYTLGFVKRIENNEHSKRKKYPIEMLVFIVHGLFLTVFCIFFVHIQVSTRLICSASPLIYWYCTLFMSCTSGKSDDDLYEFKENISSKWKVYFLTQKKYTLQDRLVLSYFLGYTILGCFMFPNFLPWT
ncbi:GPI mannosyltransferase 2 isoform X1 [Ceratina calcarata]|uniref:GPI mannosyltransferase 2 n=1 Tax=Ceratina calcarata TaxID=156304 RepID=A0AAJ7S9F6_9HYME|nr:GPI mannosyltransferase 2 isoform X1 [Ceratina calcarata]XP_026673782.1 GPI mannosyltransferase 2 isoform X1 [Ceratina calcarata]